MWRGVRGVSGSGRRGGERAEWSGMEECSDAIYHEKTDVMTMQS